MGLLPKSELDRIDTKILEKYYKPTVYDEKTDSIDFRNDEFETEEDSSAASSQ